MSFPSLPVVWHCLAMMKIRKANERGHANTAGWDTYHTFSFADITTAWMGFRSLRVINDDLVMPAWGWNASASRHGNHHLHPQRRAGAQGFDGQRPRDPPGRGAIHVRRHGRAHSEFNPSKDEAVHLLQIWIQPDAKG